MFRLVISLFKKFFFNHKERNKAKCISISLKKNYFRRYLFTVIRLFIIEGYHVKLKASPLFLLSLFREPYSKKILLEENVSLYLTKKCTYNLSDSSKPHLSPDYFTDSNAYHVPITMHPNQYISQLWKESYEVSNRRNQLFFAGAFLENLYSHPNSQFAILNRMDLLSKVKDACNTLEAQSYEELLQENREYDFIYLNSQKAIVPFEENRKTLATFRYMIAFPGANMPLCHNLAEAISVGTVPIIQKSYAKLLQPPLKDDVSAFYFTDETDLKATIEKALALPEEEFIQMSKNIKEYYETHCTPAKIVENLLKESDIIFLLGAI